ncbi:hypothetical protein KDU71_14570 [Carboxylicivirga sediminis]|uniref:Uncharacterized protein n=1 Tax=Carboxylicivirga sediminis TaxID=2006564 RepID=A0A941F7L6_9BACT|nr:hypothetical protein [Carboxylicivirga sediminis]MBR8536795.1 hypothetical protein [Carboxylicivirga sediminis]
MKTLKLYVILWALASLLLSCDSSSNNAFELDKPDELPVENYEIYSLAIDELFDAEQIVIAQVSQMNIELEPNSSHHTTLANNNPELSPDLVTDLVTQNQETVVFGEFFDGFGKDIVLLSSDEQNAIFEGPELNESWNDFYKKYSKSNGIISLSQIGFNRANNQAVFEMVHMAASLAATGSII